MAVEDVLQRALLGPRWVRALHGLRELLRVAQEDDVPRRAAHRDEVREGDLPGLVHDERVERPGRPLARPEPRGPRHDVHAPVAQRRLHGLVVVDHLHARRARRVVVVGLLEDAEVDPLLPGVLHHRLQEGADGGMAEGGDPHRPPRPARSPRPNDVRDDPRAQVRLARSGRSLDGQVRAVERQDDAACRIPRILAVAGELRPRVAGGIRTDPARPGDVRRQPQEDVADRPPVGQGRVDPVIHDPAAQVHHRRPEGLRVDRLRRQEADDRREVAGRGLRAHLDVQPSLVGMDLEDLPDDPPLGCRDRVLAAPELGLLCGVEGPPVEGRPRDGPHHALVPDPADRGGVPREVVAVEVLEPIPLEPVGPVLPSVPAQEVREQAAGLGLGREEVGVERLRVDPRHEVRAELNDGRVRVTDRVVGGARQPRRPARVGPLARHQLGASLLQPVAEHEGGDAVLAVVRGDVVEELLVARLQPALVREHRVERHRDPVRVAGQGVEGLHLLDRVRLGADADALADDPVEVHEDLRAEEDVELLLPGAVALRQAVQSGRLVRGVVVDVHPGVAAATVHDVVDERLERLLLRGAVVGPEGGEGGVGGGRGRAGGRVRAGRCACAGGRLLDVAEEVLQAIVEREPVALEVEEDVQCRRLREDPEAAPLGLLHRAVVVHRPLGARVLEDLPGARAGALLLELHRRLILEAHKDVGREIGDRTGGGGAGRAQGGERLDRRDAGPPELLDLVAADERHPREVARAVPEPAAVLRPGADRAVVGGVHDLGGRLGGGGGPREDGLLETAADQPVVRGEVGDAEGLARGLAPAQDHVDLLRRLALDRLHHPGVCEELEQRARLRGERELRVLGLVDPVAEGGGGAGAVDPPEEVGLPRPALIHERRLVDDIVAAAHRFERRLAGRKEGFLPALVRDFRNAQAVGRELLEVPVLVLQALLAEEVELGVLVERPLQEPREDRTVEQRQVRAVEEPDQIGRAEDDGATESAHGSGPPPAPRETLSRG